VVTRIVSTASVVEAAAVHHPVLPQRGTTRAAAAAAATAAAAAAEVEEAKATATVSA